MIQNASKDETDYASEFLTDLDYHIRKLDKEDSYIPSKTFKPSSLRCPRGAVMGVLGCEPNKTERNSNLIGITSSGTFIHEMIQSKVLTMHNWDYLDVAEYAKDKDDLIVTEPCDFEAGNYETKFHSKKWNMNFLVDGLLKNQKTKKLFLFEIKSINGGGFYKTKEVPEKYKLQAISYCTMLDLDSVIFLFVDRDLFNMKTFLFNVTARDKNEWKNNMERNLNYVKNGIIPAKPVFADRMFCQYCNYSESCHKLGVGEVFFGESS